MSTFKKAEVVMLPHNNIDTLLTLYKTASGKPLHLSTNLDIISHHTNQHLYIISDDEIKLFDQIYNNKENIVEKITSKTQLIFVLEENKENQTFKKIIATTDTSLKITISPYLFSEGGACQSRDFLLPQPSQQFIQKFVEEYNKGNVITDVLVEYENKFDGKEYVDELDAYGYDKIKSILKINHKDNNIIIKIAKDSWSREEVIEFGNKVKEYCKNGWKLDSLHRVFFEWDKWIEENL